MVRECQELGCCLASFPGVYRLASNVGCLWCRCKQCSADVAPHHRNVVGKQWQRGSWGSKHVSDGISNIISRRAIYIGGLL